MKDKELTIKDFVDMKLALDNANTPAGERWMLLDPGWKTDPETGKLEYYG